MYSADVQLPPWAGGSAAQFIAANRRALESSCVSGDIHLWIDLIFGHKQRGQGAKLAFNVFHPLTYEGEVNIFVHICIFTCKCIYIYIYLYMYICACAYIY